MWWKQIEQATRPPNLSYRPKKRNTFCFLWPAAFFVLTALEEAGIGLKFSAFREPCCSALVSFPEALLKDGQLLATF